jgi:hypothetical protein
MKIEFQLGNKTYKISGMTVGDWYHIQDEIILNPHASIAITSYLSGCPEEDLKQLEMEAWNLLWESVEDFIKICKAPTGGLTKEIKHEGVKYYLIDQNAMTIGEFADLDILVSSPGSEKKLHEIAAILYRPMVDGVIEAYNSETFRARAESFKLLPLNDAVKVLNFFLLSAHQSLSSTLDYLKSMIKDPTMRDQKEMLQSTLNLLQEVGTRLLSYSPMNESSNLTRLPSLGLEPVSIGSLTLRIKSESKNSNYKKLLQKINAN